MKEKVVVIGGGIAGLTAAHELVDRGFEVHVYERRPHFGGKAASVRVGKDRLPGEHGFRFYPGWYRHLPDTMKRIDYQGKRKHYKGQTVFDNLCVVKRDLLVWYDRDPISVLMHAPRSMEDARAHAVLMAQLKDLGLAPGELAFFASRMLAFAAKSDAQRLADYEGISWWDYMEADNKSRAFREMMGATTRLMVAAKAEEASAYTIGKLAMRTFSDALSSVDRVLNGPTNEVWIDPWIEDLEKRGVTFHAGWQLEAVEFHEDEPRISQVRLQRVVADLLTRLRRLLATLTANVRSIGDINTDLELDVATETLRARLHKQIADDCRAARTLSRAIRRDALWRGLRRQEERAERNGEATGAIAHVDRLLATLPDLTRVLDRLVRSDTWTSELRAPHARTSPAEAERRLASCLGVRRDDRGGWGRQFASDKARGPFRRSWMRVRRSLGEGDAVATWIDQLSTGGPAERPLPPLINVVQRIDAIEAELGKAEVAPQLDPRDEPADHFVFAVPLEQMAYFVTRSKTMTYHDPSLRRLVRLAEHTDWMAGIQFFLKEPFELVAGHVVCMDSEWALTAIEETQFWTDVEIEKADGRRLDPPVRGVLSVDIAAWDRKGRFVKKEAYNCTDKEIAHEVWCELKASINRDARFRLLRDDMLRGGKLKKNVSFHLDASIVELYDRKKQAAYERARSVRFSTNALVEQQKARGRESDTPYIWGGRLRFNVEPLLVNRAGAHQLRPEAKTAIVNMFLAADYVKTETDLACMEGANEAARRAVNALLDAAGSSKPRCELWRLATPRDVLEGLTRLVSLGDAMGSAASLVKGARGMVDGLFSTAGALAGQVMERRRRIGNG